MRWLAVVLLVTTGQVVAQESARQWLNEMSSAMQALDYDGTFVYLHDNKLETMRIIHQVTEGGEKERLVSLTGSPREVLRDDRVVTCIMPDSKSVMIGQSRPRQPFPVLPKDLDALSRYYRLEDAGEDRMAGYMTRVIKIKPKDALRYGYRFWIDKKTRMLLKFDLADVDGKAIEQVMFTSLGIGNRIPATALKPSLTGDGYTWYRQENNASRPAKKTDVPGWTVDRLPAGFSMVHFQHKHMLKNNASTDHMVFSDGLATVSVYVEKLPEGKTPVTGLSSMGAMNAYRTEVDGYQITVVGEVPRATVQMIARSVNRRS
ncbi:MAG: MucB/RseB C-terminal domain-containing protein [Gammaproteobacteria bacterium]|nr:MucB/RseB C-terminal domain-containing protein [Gammaproteobacteria bacterium]